MEEGKGTVCVTGGTGYIASMMIKRLLSQGYSVNTTVREGPGAFPHGNYLHFPVVHVDDVARAHIFMLEHPNPKGRYICSLSGTTSLEEIAKIIHAKYPEYPIPTLDSLKNNKTEDIPRLSSKKLIDAGFEFKYGPKEIFEEAVQCCKERGYM